MGSIATGETRADTPSEWASGGDSYYQTLVDDLQNGQGLPAADFMYADTESAARDVFFAQAGQDGQFGTVTEFSPSGDVPFAEATRFEVTTVPDSAFQVQIRGDISESFSAGDVMLGVAYLRSPTDSPQASVAAVDSNDYGNHVQSNSSPTITGEWERHYFPIEFGTDTAADGRGYLQFQFGAKQQTIEVGGLALLDFGTNADVSNLPSGTQSDDSDGGDNGGQVSEWPGPSDPYYGWLVEELSNDGLAPAEFVYGNNEADVFSGHYSENSAGTTQTLDVSGETVPFSQAIRFSVTSEPSNDYSAQIRTGLNNTDFRSVAAGDVLLGVAYLRAPEGGDTTVQFNVRNDNSSGFNSVVSGAQPSLTSEWQRFYFPVEIGAAADAGTWWSEFWLGYQQQTVDVGGIALLDFDGRAAAGDLPSGAADTDDYYGSVFADVVGMGLPTPEFVFADSETATRNSSSVYAENPNGNLTSPDLGGEGVPFSTADRFEITSDPSDSFEVQFRGDLPRDVSAGDVMLGVAYLRSPSDSPQAEVHAVDSNDYGNHVQRNASPSIAGEWERHYFPIEFGTDSTASERTYVQFQLGFKQQTVEVGGFALLDFGGEADVGNLPSGVPQPDEYSEWPDVSDPYYSTLVEDLKGRNLGAAGRFVYADNEADTFSQYELLRPDEGNPGSGNATPLSVGGDVPFSEATRFDITETPDNAYEFSFKSVVDEGPVNSGDVLLGVAYMRAVGDEGASVTYKSTENDSISSNYVTKSGPPIGSEWERFYFPIQFTSDGAAGEWFTEFWLGSQVQTVDIGGVALIDFAQGLEVGDLPAWQESPAEGWEAAADQRIQDHRTADLTVEVVDGDGNAVSDADVEVNMQEHDFGFGNMVAADELENTSEGDPYRENRKELFNLGVLENAHKWRFWENDKQTADNAVDWMTDLGWDVRGHVCLWASVDSYAVPNDVVEAMGVAWDAEDIEAGEADPAYVEQETTAHVGDIIDYYGDQIDEWEVVNELIPQPGFVETIHGSDVTPEEAPILADWFAEARDAAPDGTTLAINDYNTLVGPYESRRSRYEDQIEFINNTDAGLDSVGVQCHFGQGSKLLPSEIMSALDRYAANDVRLRITEFDMADDTWPEEDKAEFFYWFLKTVFSHPEVDDFVVWGLIDTLHWRDDAPFYAAGWEEKPALAEYRDLVFNQWWTEETGTTDTEGRVSVTGFKGTYEVMVDDGSTKRTVETQLSDGGDTLTVDMSGSDGGEGDVPQEVYDAAAGSDGQLDRDDVLGVVEGYVNDQPVNGVSMSRSDVINLVRMYLTG